MVTKVWRKERKGNGVFLFYGFSIFLKKTFSLFSFSFCSSRFLVSSHRVQLIRLAHIMAEVIICSVPGCLEHGTHRCSSCQNAHYCCTACQTIDWPHHKEECRQARLRRLAKYHLENALSFQQQNNYIQSLRCSKLSLVELEKLNARSLEVIMIIDDAMATKYNALKFMDQKKEALECAKKRYSLWAAGHMRDHGMLNASFALIEGLLHNNEFERAELIARTAYEMITATYDNIIPEARRQQYQAEGAYYLARATFRLADEKEMIAPEQKQKAGQKAIALAREALEIHTQLNGTESITVAMDMGALADILSYFNGVDDEILRLRQQTVALFSRVNGSSPSNVALSKLSLGITYNNMASGSRGSLSTADLGRCVTKMEAAVTHFREAERIFRFINHVDRANMAVQLAQSAEEDLRQDRIAASKATKG